MHFPSNVEELRERGYRYLENGECDACHQAVEWWRTPHKHEIPMDPMLTPEIPAKSHWATCPALHPTKQRSLCGDPGATPHKAKIALRGPRRSTRR